MYKKVDIKTLILQRSLITHNYSFETSSINDSVFINHVGLGRFEQHLGEQNKRLRFLPNGWRTSVSALLSLALTALDIKSGKEVLNLYTITPPIGQVPAFPNQVLFSDSITHAQVTNIQGLVRTLLYWQRGKPAPNGAMAQDQGPQFSDEVRDNSLWLDGDTVPYMLQGALIKRTSYGIPIVAIT